MLIKAFELYWTGHISSWSDRDYEETDRNAYQAKSQRDVVYTQTDERSDKRRNKWEERRTGHKYRDILTIVTTRNVSDDCLQNSSNTYAENRCNFSL